MLRRLGSVPCIAAITALSAIALVAVAAPANAAAERPLVYVIVLDGLEGEKIEQGKAPFISSLLAGEDANATYFPRSSSVLPAETNPNHTAMTSGAYPESSGIAANAFAIYAPLEDRPPRPHLAAHRDQRGELLLPRRRAGLRSDPPAGQSRRAGQRRDLRQAEAGPDLRRREVPPRPARPRLHLGAVQRRGRRRRVLRRGPHQPDLGLRDG
jgi:hypothetical protein